MPAIVWKGYVTFGLVSFPVRLFSAARPEAIHFHMLHRKDLSRVKEVWYCAEEDKPVQRADIVKGYETSRGEYVVVDEEDLKKIQPQTATTMEIVQFVREAEVDPIFLEHSYYMSPGDDGGKPYGLFLNALAETRYSAIAKLSMHNREHIVLLRSAKEGLVLHTLFYPDELHAEKKPAATSKGNATKKEIDLAVKLIHQLAAPFKPSQFHDTYRENVERLISEKKKGRTITAEPKPRKAPVLSLMDALKKSLDASARPKPKTTGRRKAA
jgi:DNA end-binding protein Ku